MANSVPPFPRAFPAFAEGRNGASLSASKGIAGRSSPFLPAGMVGGPSYVTSLPLSFYSSLQKKGGTGRNGHRCRWADRDETVPPGRGNEGGPGGNASRAEVMPSRLNRPQKEHLIRS